jgi:hypothetical protein
MLLLGSFTLETRAEDFIVLSAGQIRHRIVGHAIVEEIDRHWTFNFRRGGPLDTLEMGVRSTGRWEIQGNRLCFGGIKEDFRCYEVWLFGSHVRLRRSGILDLEGTIESQRENSLDRVVHPGSGLASNHWNAPLAYTSQQ